MKLATKVDSSLLCSTSCLSSTVFHHIPYLGSTMLNFLFFALYSAFCVDSSFHLALKLFCTPLRFLFGLLCAPHYILLRLLHTPLQLLECWDPLLCSTPCLGSPFLVVHRGTSVLFRYSNPLLCSTPCSGSPFLVHRAHLHALLRPLFGLLSISLCSLLGLLHAPSCSTMSPGLNV